MIHRATVAAILTVGALCIQGTPALSRQNPGTKPAVLATSTTSPDREFAKKAAGSGLAEVKLGHLAEDKGERDAVKNFGKRMVSDHTKANDELKRTAVQEKIDLPTEMNAHDQETYNRLSQLSGADFDKAFAQNMVIDHKQDVAEFKNESDKGQDQSMKDFAFRTLPTLQEHLKQALQMLHDIDPQAAKANGSK